jgi:hypothetical protein
MPFLGVSATVVIAFAHFSVLSDDEIFRIEKAMRDEYQQR